MLDELTVTIARSQNKPLREAMRALGAVSPATALARDQLPAEALPSFETFLALGILREGAPGKYYLFDPPTWPKARIIKTIAFWVILALIPPILLYVTSLLTHAK